jgi:hypothetical protein
MTGNSKSNKPEVIFKIILINAPAGVDYGIQQGAGSRYETKFKQRSTGSDLEFVFNLQVVTDPDGHLDFKGNFVQGKKGGRFIYIDIGTYAGQHDSAWSRRLKVPLAGIHGEMIKAIFSGPSGLYLTTNVAGVGKDGGPNCGTVKPFGGWSLSKG